MAPLERKLKAYGYVTRHNATQVLVFDHVDFPEAGTQVPGGTVDPSESPEQAVIRELLEEAGLAELILEGHLGAFDLEVPERNQLQERHFFHLTAVRPLPEEWIHIVSHGVEDKGLRFRYFWMDIRTAAPLLAGQQGVRLPALFAQP